MIELIRNIDSFRLPLGFLLSRVYRKVGLIVHIRAGHSWRWCGIITVGLRLNGEKRTHQASYSHEPARLGTKSMSQPGERLTSITKRSRPRPVEHRIPTGPEPWVQTLKIHKILLARRDQTTTRNLYHSESGVYGVWEVKGNTVPSTTEQGKSSRERGSTMRWKTKPSQAGPNCNMTKREPGWLFLILRWRKSKPLRLYGSTT